MLNDWNTGKIKYCTQPPENEDRDVHLSATIVSSEAREFEIDNFEQMETEVLNNFDVKTSDVMEFQSAGPVHMEKEPEEDSAPTTHIIESVSKRERIDDDDEPRAKRGRPGKKPIDPQLLLAGTSSSLVCYESSLKKIQFLHQEIKRPTKTSKIK